jgi:hypothetical protein
VLSGLYGHVTYTGISGIGLAYFVTRRGEIARLPGAHLLPGACCCWRWARTSFWNSPLLDSLPDFLFTTVKGMPFLIGLVILVYLARKRENDDLAAVLAGETGQAGLPRVEMDDLRSWRIRRETRQEGAQRSRAGRGKAVRSTAERTAAPCAGGQLGRFGG